MGEVVKNEKLAIKKPSDTMELLTQLEQQNIPQKTVFDNICLEFSKLTKADIKEIFMTIPEHFKAKLKLEY